MERTGWTQAEVARRAGASRAAVTDWVNGTTKVMSPHNAQRLGAEVGIRPEWLSTGHGVIDSDSTAKVEDAGGEYEADNAATLLISTAVASMGKGHLRPDDEVIQQVRVRRDWLRQNLPFISAPEALGVLTARGDSMTPTFSDGDQLLVDRGVNEIAMDGVFVLSRDDELFIKRVQRRMRDGAIIIKSDNALFEPETIENGERERLEVLGRVLWVWRGAKL